MFSLSLRDQKLCEIEYLLLEISWQLLNHFLNLAHVFTSIKLCIFQGPILAFKQAQHPDLHSPVREFNRLCQFERVEAALKLGRGQAELLLKLGQPFPGALYAESEHPFLILDS
jgi:hypothetical protein